MTEKIFDYYLCLSSADEEQEPEYKNVQNKSINISHVNNPRLNNTQLEELESVSESSSPR